LNIPHSSSTLKVGLLGAGYILDSHARAVQGTPGVRLHAIADLSAGRARAAAERFGCPNALDSLAAMIATGIDAVHILTPPQYHHESVRQALDAGVHVFSEKPFVLKSAQAIELAALAKARGKALAVSHNFLFARAYERLRADYRAGFFGPLSRVELTWQFPLGQLAAGPVGGWLTAEPGNIFHELGPHLVAFAVDLLGPIEILEVVTRDDLPMAEGRIVYRDWFVRAQAGKTEVNIRLSTRIGAPERSIRVFGLAASAICFFDRDVYQRSEVRSLNPLVDDLFDGARRELSGLGQVLANFGRAAIGTLRRNAQSNVYASTFARSVEVFYAGLAAEPDPRLSSDLALAVVAASETIANKAPHELQPLAGATLAIAALPTGPVVLVTGGTGFIGRVLVRQLLAKGLQIRVVTRSAEAGRIAFGALPVQLLQGSLADEAFLAQALHGVDALYHLAKGEGKRWQDYLNSDVEPTRKLAQAAAKAGVRRFIYTGTIDSYYAGDPSQVITCSTPIDPQIEKRNHYARAKAACESILLELHRSGQIKLVILRPGIVVGRGFTPAHWGVGEFLSASAMKYWGDGQHKLPFVLVEDVARALVAAFDSTEVEGKAWLVTDAPLLSGQEYVSELGRAMSTRIRSAAMPAWRSYAVDLFKEGLKHLVKHPNRRVPSLQDWKSRQHISRYDSSATQAALNWRPAGARDVLIRDGIEAPVSDMLR
jgi:nucleoside-diphosphate-sugar epimerase/predicted dehydrogenase